MTQPSETSPGEASELVEGLSAGFARMQALDREYAMLTRVVSVVVARLLELTGARAVEITDEAIEAAHGTRAWRDESRNLVMITVA